MRQRLDTLLTFKRARAYSAILVGLYVLAWGYVVVSGSPPLNNAGGPIGGDYIAFHTAGRLILEGRGAALYDHTAVTEVQASLLDGRLPHFYDAFRNPPFAALPFVPLAALDLLQGFALWTLVSLACLGVSLRLLLDEVPWLKARWRGLLLLVLGFAPVYFGIIDGENATVSLLLYVLLYRALARDQAWQAGVWAALGLFKPQLFLVFPLVFLARRNWPAVLSYGLTACALAVVSFGLVGAAGLQTWLRTLLEAESGNATANAWRMVSLKSFFDQILPGQTTLSLALYGGASLGVLALLVRAWARPRSAPLPVLWTFTCLAAVLADPHLVDYDLTVLVPAGILSAAIVPQVRWWIVVLYVLTLFRIQAPIGTASVQLVVPVLAWCAYLALRARQGEVRQLISQAPSLRLEAASMYSSPTLDAPVRFSPGGGI